MLLLANGPSIVAVRLGASVTFRIIDVVVGSKWKVAGVAPLTEVSCQPEKPSVADRLPRVSSSLKFNVKVHEPLRSVCVLMFCRPSTEEV